MIFILGIASLLKSHHSNQFAMTGTISGYTINEFSQPVPAEVFIPGLGKSCIADNSGYFQLEYIPSGEYSIIVGYHYAGRELPVTVSPGSNTKLGSIQVPNSHKSYE